jgi:hypothetical protein
LISSRFKVRSMLHQELLKAVIPGLLATHKAGKAPAFLSWAALHMLY